MDLAILLGVLAIALHFVANSTAEKYGPEVGKRWLEASEDYSFERLKGWVTGQGTAHCDVDCRPRNTADDAKHYAWPVLFPLDVLFMFALGGFLASGSVTCAQSSPLLRNLAWLFAIFPALYVAADLLEDSLLARLLLNADNITVEAVKFVKLVTWVKIKTAGLAMVQTTGLAAAALFLK